MEGADTTRSAERGIEPRRQPVQARSRERVEKILDAAVQLLAEDGYDAVKTNAIARRAGVSIGSVYQFFPNRFAIFNALAGRYREKIARSLESYLTIGPDRSWEEALEETIDILAEMWRSDWAFHSVWLAIQNTAELRDSREQYRDALLREPLARFLRALLPRAADAEIATIGRVMLESSNLLLDLSMRRGHAQDTHVTDELKFLLHSYLQAHVAAKPQ
jgi:AcrR family transcriptional regulator